MSLFFQGTVAVQVENRITAKQVIETPAPVQVISKSQFTAYKVQPGDWLSKIAKKHQVTWQELQKINKLKNPNRIYPGQEILIPKK